MIEIPENSRWVRFLSCGKTRPRYINGKFKQNVPYDWYECVCGEVKEVRRSNVISGWSKSCGCLQREAQMRNIKKADEANRKNGFKRGIPKKHKSNGLEGKRRYYFDDGTYTLIAEKWFLDILNGFKHPPMQHQ
tara:strand:+ start:245 stop:646 length:402 start_codon:yes stop_codon:yes gene_type:complete